MKSLQTPDGTWAIDGTTAEFHDFAGRLRSLVQDAPGSTLTDANVTAHFARDLVRFEEQEDGLRITGGHELLHVAAWFEALGDRGGSVELKWYPDHYYLAETSKPVTLRTVAKYPPYEESGTGTETKK
ncbi:MAG: hypothetical protein AAF488_12325 [Planctomycetota bacterium]